MIIAIMVITYRNPATRRMIESAVNAPCAIMGATFTRLVSPISTPAAKVS